MLRRHRSLSAKPYYLSRPNEACYLALHSVGKPSHYIDITIFQLAAQSYFSWLFESLLARNAELIFFPMEYMIDLLSLLRMLYPLPLHETSCDAPCHTGG